MPPPPPPPPPLDFTWNCCSGIYSRSRRCDTSQVMMSRGRCGATERRPPSTQAEVVINPIQPFVSCACTDRENTQSASERAAVRAKQKAKSRWSPWRGGGFQSPKTTRLLNWECSSARELGSRQIIVCCPLRVFGNKSLLHNSWQQQRFIEGAVPARVEFKLISSESSEPAKSLRGVRRVCWRTCAHWLRMIFIFLF